MTLASFSSNLPISDLSEIVEGWAETTLDQILVALESGSRPRGGVRGIEAGVPSIGGEHLNENGGFRFGSIKYVPLGFYQHMNSGHIQIGDVLIVKDGATTGKVSLVRSDFHLIPAVVNEHVFICRISEEILPSFIFYYLFSSEGQNQILDNFRGSAQGGINQGFTRGTCILIAPLAEQKRIVEKVEELLAQVNAVRERLDKVSKIMKRFRQSVLAAACSGKLTEDWREEQGRADEWTFVPLRELCDSLNYGTSAKSQPVGTVPVLRMGNIQNGEIDWTDLVYTSDKEEIRKYSLKPKTVLFNRTNSPELVGKTAIYRGERTAIFAGYLIRINHREVLDPEYLNYCLNTTSAKEYCHQVKTDGVSQSNINAQKLADFEVPYCPLDEQQEIVRRVETLFNLADAIEQRVTAASARADRLTQSILAKAFRGELVPTEAELARKEGRDYEPASVLLERIKAEREREQPRGRKKRR